MDEETDADVYKSGSEEEMVDNDEITAEEAAFIAGYNDADEPVAAAEEEEVIE